MTRLPPPGWLGLTSADEMFNDAFDLEEERANRLKERMKLMRAMAPPPPRSVQHGFRSGFLSAKEVGLAD